MGRVETAGVVERRNHVIDVALRKPRSAAGRKRWFRDHRVQRNRWNRDPATATAAPAPISRPTASTPTPAAKRNRNRPTLTARTGAGHDLSLDEAVGVFTAEHEIDQ